MSLTASMWTGISGLLSHGEKMNVIGNNLANVNTVGFKGARMDFEDFIQQDVNSAAGVTQVGRGVSIGAIYGDFSQGAFETTNEATDLAISGKGFFQVKVPDEDTEYYTRSGNFRFDKDGYLTDPHGYRLQGWGIETPKPSLATGTVAATSSSSKIKGAGVPKDIQLAGFTAEPKHTSTVELNVNLDASAGGNKSTGTAVDTDGDGNTDTTVNGMTALHNAWDGSSATPLSDDSFAYQTTVKVYDAGGTAHNLTVYFDQVDDAAVSNLPAGQKQWEFIVTVPPSEDGRSYPTTNTTTPDTTDIQDTKSAGLLMTGTLTFDSAGQLVNQSAYSLNLDPANVVTNSTVAAPTPLLSAAEATALGIAAGAVGADGDKNFTATDGSKATVTVAGGVITKVVYEDATGNVRTGTYTAGGGDYNTLFTATAPGHTQYDALSPNTKALWKPTAYSNNGYPMMTANFSGLSNANWTGDSNVSGSLMEMNFGLKYTGSGSPGTTTANLGDLEATVTAGTPPTAPGGTTAANFSLLPNVGSTSERQSSATTSFTGASSTLKQSQDGYTFGFLQNVSVDRDGILSGRYSNGVVLDLYQVTLYDFQSNHNLRREGGNLFSATRDSGDAAPGPANANGLGSVHSNSLEQSNVDMAKEFVSMITTQRGFQGNSKVITTTDRMLETVVQMKR